jgi:multiple antibiotic resistance protein
MLDYFLNALVTLFVTMDPVGLAPMFLVLTSGMSNAERHQIALRAVLIAAAVLVAFAAFGQALLTFLGISLPAFRIAGGLLLFWIAFEMVFEKRDQRKTAAVQKAADEPESRQNVAVFPLAIPLIAGPGAISATILLASRTSHPVDYASLGIVIVGLIGACFGVFYLAGRIDRFLGDTGRIVVSRLLGVILAALAVQFVADGVLAFAANA